MESGQTDANRESGVEPTSDGGWILNPGATFTLTLYGPKEAVETVRNLIKAYSSKGIRTAVKQVLPVFVASQIRCKEIDDYLEKYGPVFLAGEEPEVMPYLEDPEKFFARDPKALVEVLVHTFLMAPVTSVQFEAGEGLDPEDFKGWKVDCSGDSFSCQHCKKLKKSYPLDNPPKSPPFHIGCRCSVIPVSK